MSATQVPLPGAAASLIGLAALGAVAFDGSWLVIRYVTVMAHEGAHAVAAVLLARGASGITLKPNADGETNYVPGGTPGKIGVGFVGYVGPSMFGLGAAKLIELGHIVAVLWVALVLLAFLLAALRISFGLVTVVLVGFLASQIVRYTPVPVQVVAAYVITWLLLLSGVRRIFERGADSKDAKDLRSLTNLPRSLWSLLWLAAALAAVAVGGNLLVMQA